MVAIATLVSILAVLAMFFFHNAKSKQRLIQACKHQAAYVQKEGRYAGNEIDSVTVEHFAGGIVSEFRTPWKPTKDGKLRRKVFVNSVSPAGELWCPTLEQERTREEVASTRE